MTEISVNDYKRELIVLTMVGFETQEQKDKFEEQYTEIDLNLFFKWIRSSRIN